MDTISPAQVTSATFRTTRKGYDPDEVDAFLAEVAKALEVARQQATAMEARARAAVARLQEATSATGGQAPAPPPAPAAPEPTAPAGDARIQIPAAEAETISRTLLLAQKTADSTVAEARAEADRIVGAATADAEATIDSTREMSAQLLEDARAEARRASDDERRIAENEVEALVARREFLVADVDQLERFLIDQRDRLRGAARQIEALVDRVPEGLGAVRPPVLSASNDHDDLDPTQELIRRPPTDDASTDDEPRDPDAGDADDAADDAAASDDTSSDDTASDEDGTVDAAPSTDPSTGAAAPEQLPRRLSQALQPNPDESDAPRR